MIKQRSTIFNPQQTNDDVVSSITRDQVIIKTSDDESRPFILENKITIPHDSIPEAVTKYNLVKQLRIQATDNSIQNDTVFTFTFSRGLNIYVIPKSVHNAEEQVEFFGQVNQLLHELLDVDVKADNWIRTINSLYFHDDSPKKLNLSWFQAADEDLIESSQTYDLVVNNDDDSEDAKSSLVLKQLSYLPISQEFSIATTENVRKEIGLFIIDQDISTVDDIVLSGVRVILEQEETEEAKEDEHIFKTLFHVKPRHRFINATLSSSIIKNGLHPILKSDFESLSEINDIDVLECNLYYYINLNKSLIFDQYQSIPQGSSLVVNNGISNLELPEYKVTEWGSEILFEFSNISQGEVEFSLHSRYQLPNQSSNSTVIHNSLPQIFYGCNVRDEYLLDKSPFDTRLEIGGNYVRYFTENTVFYHLQHSQDSSVIIDIPNASGSLEKISSITVIAVLLGVTIILYRLLRVVFAGHRTVSSVKKNQ